jgi:hypothetical protein
MKTETELELEKQGIYMVDAVFSIIKDLPLKDIAKVHIYQFGQDKKGYIYNASIDYNGEVEYIKGYENTIGSKVADFLKGRDSVTNHLGRRMSCTYGRIKEVEKKVKKVIPNFKKIIGIRELLNAMVLTSNR